MLLERALPPKLSYHVPKKSGGEYLDHTLKVPQKICQPSP